MAKPFQSIKPQDLHQLLQRDSQLQLIDVRSPVEYQSGHAIGAKLLPLDQLSPKTLIDTLDATALEGDKPLYITCQSGLRAQQAAERLQETGHDNLVLLEGGTDAWISAGLPVKRCARVISLERQVQISIGALLILKVAFGFTVHELFFLAGALIGAGLIVAGITRWCGMANLIAQMPWNRKGNCSETVTN